MKNQVNFKNESIFKNLIELERKAIEALEDLSYFENEWPEALR